MPVLTRLIPSPISVDIRAGALEGLASLLADQRIAPTGRLAFAISEGSGRATMGSSTAAARPVPGAALRGGWAWRAAARRPWKSAGMRRHRSLAGLSGHKVRR
jgi:glycerol-1-phosphate dehydrogenase [NAD(P)+]